MKWFAKTNFHNQAFTRKNKTKMVCDNTFLQSSLFKKKNKTTFANKIFFTKTKVGFNTVKDGIDQCKELTLMKAFTCSVILAEIWFDIWT